MEGKGEGNQTSRRNYVWKWWKLKICIRGVYELPLLQYIHVVSSNRDEFRITLERGVIMTVVQCVQLRLSR